MDGRPHRDIGIIICRNQGLVSVEERLMKFSRWVFNIAGVYGVISVAPLYFMEQAIGAQDPPPITHPMFFYGFVGVALAWQLLFFAIVYQPVRLRPVIPFAVLEKLSFGIGAMVLYRRGRLDHSDLYFGGIDLALAVLFMVVWRRLAREGTPG
jgi:hypothetical protein